MSVSLYRLLNLVFFIVVTEASSKDNPRVVLDEKDAPKRYSLPGNSTRIEFLDGPNKNSIFVGGHGRLWYIDFNRIEKSKEVKFPVLEKKTSDSKPTAPCNYDVTTLHKVNDTLLFVCASHEKDPKCCFMSTKKLEMRCTEDINIPGIAPLNVNERAPSLYLEGHVYAAVNLSTHDNRAAIRRIGKNGIRPNIDKKEQRYVSMAFSGPREDPFQGRVYAFLMQKRSNEDIEASSWTSWVTQVCKADMGGPKALLQMSWTSRLSARLSCGIHDRKLFFNELLDVTVLQEANWTESRVYGLFKNSWGKTAVCVYKMADIDRVFSTSDFKGFTGTVPTPRPGVCVQDSRKLDLTVLKHIKEYPEMKDWVWPVQGSGPLMVSDYDYRNIRADRVKGGGRHQRNYNVLFLSLESGSVHKVLEHAGEAFIIAELQPFRSRTNILNMLLPPSTGKLYVSSSSEVVELDLQGCQRYGSQCEDCVQARDPYCSWNGTHCAATAESGKQTQDVEHGDYSVCREGDGPASMPQQPEVEKVPLAAIRILRCPAFSRHAEYYWLHNRTRRECLWDGGSCLLLIDSVTAADDGLYTCRSREGGWERTLAQHRLLTESGAPRTESGAPRTKSGAPRSARAPPALACLLLSLALVR